MTWGGGCTGTGGSPAAGDTVTIDNGDTVTVTANAAATSVTLLGGSANNVELVVNAGITMTVSGNVTAAASTSNTRTRRIRVLSGGRLLIGGNLALNSGSVTGSVLDVPITSNASSLIQVGGSISFSGTVAPTINFAGAGTLSVAGDFGNGGGFTAGTGTVIYNGSGAQNLGNYTYSTLQFNKTGGTATATGNVTAATLNFAAGNTGIVSMTTGTLSVTGTCLTSIVRTGSGHVVGKLELTFPSGNPTCTYPVGDPVSYTPITLAVTGSGGGTLTGSVTKADHPQKATWPVSTSKYVQRYWTLGATGDTLTTLTSYNATLNYVAGDILGGADYTDFILAQYQGGWIVPNPNFTSNTGTSIVASGITTKFATPVSYVVGEPYACLPPSSAPAGVTCQCDSFGRSSLNPSTIFGANWLLSTSNGGFGIPKIINPGFLRLTDNTNDNASSATIPGIFPAAGNYISVEFKQYAYNGSGADGIAVTLSDYSIAPTPGAFGGSLGYAQKPGINGFAGGWVGVALDEFGNFENSTESRSGGAGTVQFPESIGVRGSGSGTTGYNWLAGALNLGANTIDNRTSTTPLNGYAYQVIVDARNYINTAKTALVSVNRDTTGVGNTYTNVVAPFDAYVVNPTQAAVPTNWQISFTGSTGGATNIHEIGALKVCAATFLPPTATSSAADFNAIDSALPNTKQNALFGHIYMKIANVSFNLNVAALLPEVGGVSQGVNTVYATSGTKNVSVTLIDDSLPGTSCNSTTAACIACAKNQVAIANMTFTAADGGFKTSPALAVNGGYKRLIARVSDGTTVGCSTDAFSVRPAAFALSNDLSGTKKAGASFNIIASPLNNFLSGTSSGVGAPTLDNAKAPAAGGNQTLLLQTWNTGATSGSFIYNDVGSFTLPKDAIYDRQFGNTAGEAQDQTNGDCNPGSGTPYSANTCYGYSGGTCTNATPYAADAAGKYGCDIGSIASTSMGRFFPDHYEASVAMTQGCSADAFSYMGQPFAMTGTSTSAMQVKALAAGQTFATGPGLPSYTGSYSPRATVWFGAQNGAASTTDLIKCISTTQNTSANRCALTTLPFKTSASNTWTAGIYSAPTGSFYFDPPKDATTTADATWGPYDSLNVGVSVLDSDGSTLTIPAGQSFVLNASTYQAINGSTAAKQRYGRMRMANASGSDQVPLLLPVYLEYWTGAGWAPNSLDDSCTRLTTPQTANGGNSAASACFGTTCTSATSGTAGSIYTTRVKGVGANATVPSYSTGLFAYGQRNVFFSPPNASGTLGISVEAPAWLKLGPNDPTGINPSATIRFGSYNSRFIFLRENY
ncbi:MAG: DUF6701 domain-containing protein [Betaproteobacteria bacterium]